MPLSAVQWRAADQQAGGQPSQACTTTWRTSAIGPISSVASFSRTFGGVTSIVGASRREVCELQAKTAEEARSRRPPGSTASTTRIGEKRESCFGLGALYAKPPEYFLAQVCVQPIRPIAR